MEINETPKMGSIEEAETGCCPKFDPAPWDGKTFVFKDKLFLKAETVNFMHMPLNLGPVMTRTWEAMGDAGAVPENFLVLSCDPSPWRAEHYFAVTEDVPGYEMVRMSGEYMAKVYEGPFKDIRKWMCDFEKYIKGKGGEMKKLYFFYTTCPKCAKHYGKNYVVAFAQVG